MSDALPAPAAPLLLPAPAFHALRDALLATENGEQRLRDAGFAAGQAVYDEFRGWLAARGAVDDPARIPLERFAAALGDYAATHGWGTLRLAPDPGGATVVAHAGQWFEAGGLTDAPHPSCHFTTGLLAGFFGRVAGRPLAVLETACAACGAPACEFLIGSPSVLDRVYAERYERPAAHG